MTVYKILLNHRSIMIASKIVHYLAKTNNYSQK